MAFEKLTYVDGETVIPAKNLNDIQDELIRQAKENNTPLATHDTPGKVKPSSDFGIASDGTLSLIHPIAVVNELPEEPDADTLYLVVPWEEPVAEGDTLSVSQVYSAVENGEYLEVT